MATLDVFLSTVKDGSMLSRNNSNDTAVINNRRRFLASHSIPFETTTRVEVNTLERATVTHDPNFCRYVYITDELVGDGMDKRGSVISDALITDKKNQPIMLGVADCVGAVLFDPIHSILMVTHLGRHSLEQQGAIKSIEYLSEKFGSNPLDLQVWLSPAPSKESYQIWALENKGMKEATFEQLYKAGIRKENITDDSRDTATDTDFYSYSEFLKGNRKEDGDHMIVAVMK